MTSISSNQFIHQSPRTMMDARIAAAASAGSISATDQTALGSALDSIDSSLSADATSSNGRPSGDIKSKIDDLIQKQVDAGTLTADQATELKDFFAQGPGQQNGQGGESDGMAMGGMQGMGGPGGPGGPPPPPGGSSDSDDSDSSSSDSSSTSAADQLDTLIAFLEKLRGSLSDSTYGSSSNSASDSSNSGLIVNCTA